MNLLNPTNVWQAQNLPDGLSLNNGVISGTPTVTGNFSVPVSVSNPLGSDTKNIYIMVKHRPGTQKFSILQDGVEVAKLTIPELQAMVQDGSAQTQFNCYNTQIVLPVLTPELRYYTEFEHQDGGSYTYTWDYGSLPSFLQDVKVNFCSFRDVTLQDGSTRPGLILQFANTLWAKFAPFDTGDYVDGLGMGSEIHPFNRWRYSNLRQWLNSEGLNWFTPAYDGDALVTQMEIAEARYYYRVNDPEYSDDYKQNARNMMLYEGTRSSYADDDVRGFLDFLPDDLHSILQPIKIVTQAFFDENNTNTSIEDPEDVDGYDADITYDKVFIPSLKEMFLSFTNPYNESVETMQEIAQEGIEGTPWEFFINKFTAVAYSTYTNSSYDWIKAHNGEWPYYIGKSTASPFEGTSLIDEWGIDLTSLIKDDPAFMAYLDYLFLYHGDQSFLTRTAVDNSIYGIWSIRPSGDDLYRYSDNDYANPAPAFVIC